MAAVKAPGNLPELVRAAFNRAKASGDLTFFPTQVTVLVANTVPFQLRFSPSLTNKPKSNDTTSPPSSSSGCGNKLQQQKKKLFDPFDNPPPALLITQLPPAHILVLNKFAIVPEHFILATRDFCPQTHLLELADLAATWACIDAYHNSNPRGGGVRELFAFFNSGEHSGASQPHRHLQLLPVERMRDGLDGEEEADGVTITGWQVLADRIVDGDGHLGSGGPAELPFAAFGERLRADETAETLHATYLRLYTRACAAADAAAAHGSQSGGQNPSSSAEAEAEATVSEAGGEAARISYNLAMTHQAMVLAPRTSEGGTVVAADGESVGKLALNGTVLAGTALVKSEAEWDALRGDPAQLLAILGRIGVPAVKGSS